MEKELCAELLHLHRVRFACNQRAYQSRHLLRCYDVLIESYKLTKSYRIRVSWCLNSSRWMHSKFWFSPLNYYINFSVFLSDWLLFVHHCFIQNQSSLLSFPVPFILLENASTNNYSNNPIYVHLFYSEEDYFGCISNLCRKFGQIWASG